jgi:uncharacterized protein YndB with AHSA1/START domain
MPTVRRTRKIDASPEELWEVLGDPHHLPRWWPRVSRVEAVELRAGDHEYGAGDYEGGAAGDGGVGGAAGEPRAFTEVLMGSSGKIVRADFDVLAVEGGRRIVWSQRVENTPFARVLRSAETEITLSAAATEHGADVLTGGQGAQPQATEVTIELRQELQRFSPRAGTGSWLGGFSRFGSPLVRRAAHSTLDEALDGLERIVGR